MAPPVTFMRVITDITTEQKYTTAFMRQDMMDTFGTSEDGHDSPPSILDSQTDETPHVKS